MGMVSIKEHEAKYVHQKFYDDHFEVILMDRAGPWDFPPFSWAYGASDIGSWSGLMSTNGKKVVITRSSFFELSKIKKTYEFSKEDIKELKSGIFKTKITLNKKISGLTKGSPLRTFCMLLGGALFFIPTIIIHFMVPARKIEIRPKDEFKNLEKFEKLLAS